MNAFIALLLRLLLIFLSYIFIGWVAYIIYKDLKTTTSEKNPKSIPPIALEVEIDQEITEKRFSKPQIIIGRDPACDFPLSDEMVSLRHCKLSYYQNQWWVEDLGSTNGSFLNGSLIKTATVLADGDEVTVGQVSISIKFC